MASERLLVDAVRALEETTTDDHTADDAGRRELPDEAAALTVRARAHRQAHLLREALGRTQRSTWLLMGAGALLAAVAGGAAARTALSGPVLDGGGQGVNALTVIVGLLGIQVLLLLVWLLIIAFSPGGAAPLGLLLASVVRRAHGAFARSSPLAGAAVAAHGQALLGGRAARWVLSGFSHALWCAFNVGIIVVALVLLATNEYVFTWQTTILNDEQARDIARAIGTAPHAIGFPVPSDEQFAGSQIGLDTDAAREARRAWSGLLIGAVVLYGLLPRLAATGVCVILARRRRQAETVDTGAPSHRRALARMRKPSTAVDAETALTMLPPRAIENDGTAAIVAFELDAPACPWPPAMPTLRFNDLGFVETGADRERVLEALRAQAPGVIVVACDLRATPDRGFAAFLESLDAPLALLLSGGQALRERGGDVAHRVTLYRDAARSLGISGDAIIELDLDHATAVSWRQLEAVVRGNPSAAAPVDREGLDRALAVIARASDEWTAPPDANATAALHGRIAESLEHGLDHQRLFTLANGVDVPTLTAEVAASSQRLVELLPARLRLDPRWVAAGALAGAAGCAAAALTLAPAALGALPLWSLFGAAIGGALPGTGAAPDPSESRVDITRAVHAATLYALVLALQALPEARISTVLDTVLRDAPEFAAGDGAAVRTWHDELRWRLDRALTGSTR